MSVYINISTNYDSLRQDTTEKHCFSCTGQFWMCAIWLFITCFRLDRKPILLHYLFERVILITINFFKGRFLKIIFFSFTEQDISTSATLTYAKLYSFIPIYILMFLRMSFIPKKCENVFFLLAVDGIFWFMDWKIEIRNPKSHL